MHTKDDMGCKEIGIATAFNGNGDTGRYWGSQRARLGEYAYSIRSLAVPEDWWLMVVIYLMHQLQYVAVQRCRFLLNVPKKYKKSMEGTTWNRYHKCRQSLFDHCFMAGHLFRVLYWLYINHPFVVVNHSYTYPLSEKHVGPVHPNQFCA